MGDTIQSLLDAGSKLWANCGNPACLHSSELPLSKWRETYGPDMSVMHDDLAHRLKCTRCGQKRAFLTHHVDTTKPSGWVNPYIKAKGG